MDAEHRQQCHSSSVAFVLTIGVHTDDDSLEVSYLRRFAGTKWSNMSIRSYFTVKKRDVLEGKLEKVNCSCFHGGVCESRAAAHSRSEAHHR